MNNNILQPYFKGQTVARDGDRFQYTSIFHQTGEYDVEIQRTIRDIIDAYRKKELTQIHVFFEEWPRDVPKVNENRRSAVNHIFSQQFATFLQILDMQVPSQKIQCLLYKAKCKVSVKFTSKQKQERKMMLVVDFKDLPIEEQLKQFDKIYEHLSAQLAQATVFNDYMEDVFKEKNFCLVLRGNEAFSKENKNNKILNAKYYYCVDKKCKLGQCKFSQRSIEKGVRIHPSILESQGNLIRLKINRQTCAVKKITINHTKEEEKLENSQRRRLASKEYRIIKLINQMSYEKQLPGRNYIIKILDIVQNIRQTYNIYEHCQYNLRIFIEKRRKQKTLNYNIIYHIMFQLALVLKLIQDDLICEQKDAKRVYNALQASEQEMRKNARCLIHRDLKLQNIVVSHSSKDYVLVKVIDWQQFELIPRQQLSNVSSAGTIVNNAPQVSQKLINQKSDNWLLGVIFAKLFDNQVENKKPRELPSYCSNIQFQKSIAQVQGINASLQTKIKGLVIGLLNESVVSRWSIQTALKYLSESLPDDLKSNRDRLLLKRSEIYNRLTSNHNLYGILFLLKHPYQMQVDPPYFDCKTQILLTIKDLLQTYRQQGITEINIEGLINNTIITHNWHSEDLKPFQCTEANKKAAHLIYEEVIKQFSQRKQKIVIDIFRFVMEYY